MEVALGLIFFVICFGSLLTTFVAIFQIISNDFNGSKGLWIIISMVAIIGPILYLTKGRKLIIKRDHNQIVNKDGSNSIEQYYIDLLSELDTKIKAIFGVSICLVVFGYLVRMVDLYFFWESKSLGFTLLLVSLAIFLRKDITTRKNKNLKNIWSHIGFWLIGFIVFVKVLMLVIIPNSDAYEATKAYLKNNSELKSEIGEVKGHTILPSGSIQSTTDSNGTYGSAAFNLIIKGEKKFIERTIYVNKSPDEDWSVVAVE
ncbi:hypothetical protein [Algoriphagus pacificus]|uniref:Uncharacterized protein n=1 Tax=Algoriphagus pacificus TaxID=2811234 RepID=A0ABS3CDJ7_9BACT|nr:hypothetical protein [Algoriphagus pacificus]MBN7815179.1 hypothetical protein [Algoriphagus pacificus]